MRLCIFCDQKATTLEHSWPAWMDALLGGFFKAEAWFRLDGGDQHLVAAWCMKTAMVFECTKPDKSHFYTRAEREHLRSSLNLPAGTALWIGRQHRSDFTYCHARQLRGTRPGDEVVLSEGHVTTFAAARVVLQILTVRRTPEYEGRLRQITLDATPGPWSRRGGRGLIQIWPASPSIRWPRTGALASPTSIRLARDLGPSRDQRDAFMGGPRPPSDVRTCGKSLSDDDSSRGRPWFQVGSNIPSAARCTGTFPSWQTFSILARYLVMRVAAQFLVRTLKSAGQRATGGSSGHGM